MRYVTGPSRNINFLWESIHHFRNIVEVVFEDFIMNARFAPSHPWTLDSKVRNVQKYASIKEKLPENLALCIFFMMYKNKGSKDDYTYTKCRFAGVFIA